MISRQYEKYPWKISWKGREQFRDDNEKKRKKGISVLIYNITV